MQRGLVLDAAAQDGLGGFDVRRQRIERGIQRSAQATSDSDLVTGIGHGRPSSIVRASFPRPAAGDIARPG